MFDIRLKNNKKFNCDKDSTILDAAKKAGLVLEYSCLSARCRSCVVKVLEGETENVEKELVLSNDEKKEGYVLSCNARPLTNISLDIEDLGVTLYEKKIVPAKINSIELITSDVIKVILRLPPNANFQFISGQYLNLIRGDITRSYSIANGNSNNGELEFFIKKYKNGLMSQYWFHEAKVNDLLRAEGPLGTFFLRETAKKNIIFLATGTGVAPIKSILDELQNNQFEALRGKKIWVFVGARHQEDLFWQPNEGTDIEYIPTLSRASDDWKGNRGYVQDSVLIQNIDLKDAQVYACGSNDMIKSAKKVLIMNSLEENQFYSDAFLQTN